MGKVVKHVKKDMNAMLELDRIDCIQKNYQCQELRFLLPQLLKLL
jgi:hypothetical protein